MKQKLETMQPAQAIRPNAQHIVSATTRSKRIGKLVGDSSTKSEYMTFHADKRVTYKPTTRIGREQESSRPLQGQMQTSNNGTLLQHNQQPGRQRLRSTCPLFCYCRLCAHQGKHPKSSRNSVLGFRSRRRSNAYTKPRPIETKRSQHIMTRKKEKKLMSASRQIKSKAKAGYWRTG